MLGVQAIEIAGQERHSEAPTAVFRMGGEKTQVGVGRIARVVCLEPIRQPMEFSSRRRSEEPLEDVVQFDILFR